MLGDAKRKLEAYHKERAEFVVMWEDECTEVDQLIRAEEARIRHLTFMVTQCKGKLADADWDHASGVLQRCNEDLSSLKARYSMACDELEAARQLQHQHRKRARGSAVEVL